MSGSILDGHLRMDSSAAPIRLILKPRQNLAIITRIVLTPQFFTVVALYLSQKLQPRIGGHKVRSSRLVSRIVLRNTARPRPPISAGCLISGVV